MQIEVTPAGWLRKDRDPLDVVEHVLLVSHKPMDAQDVRQYGAATWGWKPSRDLLLRALWVLYCQERAVEVRKGVYIHPNYAEE